MIRTFSGVVVALLIVVGSSTAGAQEVDQCVTCHELLGGEPTELFKGDVHSARGIGCADCHGGDPAQEDMELSMNTNAGFIGVPRGNQISEVCSGCHSNSAKMIRQYSSAVVLGQLELLNTSAHGQLSTGGSDRIAQCTSCHRAHGIYPNSDRRSSVHPVNLPSTCARCHASAGYMKTYNPALPVDQFDKYRSSVHGTKNARGDERVAECASCHGSHEILSAKDVRSKVYPTNLPETCAECHSNAEYMKGYGIASDQYEKYSQSVHGIALLQNNDLGSPACNDCHGNHAATPPGVESISKVCGTCHALNAELFSASPHKKAFDEQLLPECETCHGYHDVVEATDQLLGVGDEAVCSWCHGGEPESRGFRVAAMMRQMVDSLTAAETIAAETVHEAEQKGMEISEAKFRLREVRQSRLKSRTTVHSFDDERFTEVVTKGLDAAAEIQVEANAVIDDYYYRRWGLLFATLVITALCISLYGLIRRFEAAGQK